VKASKKEEVRVTSRYPKYRPIDPQAVAVDVPQAARLLGLSVQHTWRLVYGGALPSLKVGRRRLIRRTAVEAFVTDRAAAADGLPN
jgi:excisionase family DNA binding protein